MKADAGGILRFTAEAQESGERLDLVLSRHDGLSRSAVQKAIEAGNVTVNGLVAVKNYKIRTGDCIEYVQSVPRRSMPPQKTFRLILYTRITTSLSSTSLRGWWCTRQPAM